MVHPDVPPHPGPRLALCSASGDHSGALPAYSMVQRNALEEMHPSSALICSIVLLGCCMHTFMSAHRPAGFQVVSVRQTSLFMIEGAALCHVSSLPARSSSREQECIGLACHAQIGD